MKRTVGLLFATATLLAGSLAGSLVNGALAQGMTSFTVTVENVSTDATLTTPDGTVAVPLSPGVWVTASEGSPLFTVGEVDKSQGLEALAEDGNAVPLGEYLAGEMMAGHSGVFDTPVGATEPGPLLPGQSYTFSFDAGAGDKLFLATMFVQSNDLFYAPIDTGVALFSDDGEPVSGEVALSLWDAGTEVNEEAGVGAHQAPRQMGPNDGDTESEPVMLAGDLMTNGPVLKVTITPNP